MSQLLMRTRLKLQSLIVYMETAKRMDSVSTLETHSAIQIATRTEAFVNVDQDFIMSIM